MFDLRSKVQNWRVWLRLTIPATSDAFPLPLHGIAVLKARLPRLIRHDNIFTTIECFSACASCCQSVKCRLPSTLVRLSCRSVIERKFSPLNWPLVKCECLQAELRDVKMWKINCINEVEHESSRRKKREERFAFWLGFRLMSLCRHASEATLY